MSQTAPERKRAYANSEKGKASARLYREANRLRQREHNRNWREATPGYSSRRYRQMRDERPDMVRAHHALNNAIRAGQIVRRPCEFCGDPQSRGHHDDYSKPLEAVWVCELHHKQIHPVRAPEANRA